MKQLETIHEAISRSIVTQEHFLGRAEPGSKTEEHTLGMITGLRMALMVVQIEMKRESPKMPSRCPACRSRNVFKGECVTCGEIFEPNASISHGD